MEREQVKIFGTLLFKRGTQDDLASIVLSNGEPAFEMDTYKMKIGNGIDTYASLPYISGDEEQIASIQRKLDIFLADADLTESAIDTLAEIQNMLNNNQIDLEDLIKKIAEFETLHTYFDNSINQIRTDFTKTDKELNEEIKNIKAAYVNADQVLYEQITSDYTTITNALDTNYKSADQKINTALDNEIDRATSAEYQALTDAKAYTDKLKTDLLGEGITETFDTLVEIQDWINQHGADATELASTIATETNNRIAQDTALNTRIDNMIKQHNSDLETINSEFETAYDQCVTELSTRIDNEVSVLQKTDRDNLAEAKAYTDTAKATLFGEGTANFDTIVKLSAKTQELIDIFPPYVAGEISTFGTQIRAEMDEHHNNIINYVNNLIGAIENGTY